MASNAQQSKNSTSSTTNDNDVVADNGSIALGEGAQYATSTMEDSVSLGDGASFSVNNFDEKSAQLIDNAQKQVYLTAENAMELSASILGLGEDPITANNPSIAETVATQNIDASQSKFKWVVGALLAVVALFTVRPKGK